MVIIRFAEDLLLFSGWFRKLLQLHFSDNWDIRFPISVEMHVVPLNRVEVDVVVRSNSKVIAIELKESDYTKVIEQAIKRRDLFDYVYVTLNLSTHTILGILRNYKEALEHGIGFISASDDCIVIKAYDKRHKHESKRYTKILDFLTQ